MKPTLSDILNHAFDVKINEIHTAIVGEIVKYDPSIAKAEVKPLIQRVLYNDKVITLPIITNVPISFPKTKKAGLTFPLEAGDTGTIFFTERSLERWLSVGGLVEPGNKRKFDISDAIFYPGVTPFNESVEATASDLILRYNAGRYVINSDGKLAIGKDDNELIALVLELIDKIKQLTYGGHGIDNPQILDPVISGLTEIKGNLV